MNLSIVIVNWNTKDLVCQCLDTIIENPPSGDYDIWVVDNASSDGSAEVVQKRFPQVNLIDNDKNIGFASANNLALERCQGNYILLLNPDTKVLPEALNHLSAFLDTHPKAGAAGARLLFPDRTFQTSCYPFPTLSKELWRLLHLDSLFTYGVYQQNQWDQTEARKVDVIQGAAFLVRKEVLDQVGYFDPDYFMYTEEVDLCYRIHQAGWSLYWVPQSEIIHYEGQSTKQIPVDMFIHLYKSKLLFFRKNHGNLTGFIYKLILGLTALPRLLLIPLSKIKPSLQKQERMQVAINYQQLLLSLRNM